MGILVLISFLILYINLIFGHVQDTKILCNYDIDDSHYICWLNISNPKGYDRFKRIAGTHISGKSDSDVENIFATSGFSKNVPSILCDKFKNVQMIVFLKNEIQQINGNSFRNCKMLSYLDLELNNISKIDEKSFVENLELIELDLTSNQLMELPENVFATQHKLKSLTISNNKISDLPDNIFKPLKQLASLNLGLNKISRLKVEWFKTLENLRKLELYSNEITDLPPNVFSPLKNLVELWISQNNLKVINSNSFSNHPKMINIFAEYNQIVAVDRKLIENVAVSRFNMENNMCTNKDIDDDSLSRWSMRVELQVCFEKFENLMAKPNKCSNENLVARVCRIERENEKFRENLKELVQNEDYDLNSAFKQQQQQILFQNVPNIQVNTANREEALNTKIQKLTEDNEELLLKFRELEDKFAQFTSRSSE